MKKKCGSKKQQKNNKSCDFKSEYRLTLGKYFEFYNQ